MRKAFCQNLIIVNVLKFKHSSSTTCCLEEVCLVGLSYIAASNALRAVRD